MTDHVRLAFYKASGTITDKAIRFVTRSAYSHVELIGHDGKGWSASPREGLVRKKQIDFDDSWDIIDIPWVSTDDACARIEDEIGKSYDYAGIFLSQILSLNRSNPDKWFCSELVAKSIGLPDPNEYSPGSLSNTVGYLRTFKKVNNW